MLNIQYEQNFVIIVKGIDNMSKKLAVLLLSDLHIEKNKNGCQLYEGVDGDYYHKFKNYILDKDIQNEFNIKYLVITGDIVESGMPSQYKLAEEILDSTDWYKNEKEVRAFLEKAQN